MYIDKDTKENTLVEVIGKLSGYFLIEDKLEEYRLVVTYGRIISFVGAYTDRGEAQNIQHALKKSLPSSCTVEVCSTKHCDFASPEEFLLSFYK